MSGKTAERVRFEERVGHVTVSKFIGGECRLGQTLFRNRGLGSTEYGALYS